MSTGAKGGNNESTVLVVLPGSSITTFTRRNEKRRIGGAVTLAISSWRDTIAAPAANMAACR